MNIIDSGQKRKNDERNHFCCMCAKGGTVRWGAFGFEARLFGRQGKKTYWFCSGHRENAEANLC